MTDTARRRQGADTAPGRDEAAALDFPPGTRGFQINGGEMGPDYRAGDVLFIAPSAEGEYAAVDGGRAVIVGKLVGFLRVETPA